MILRRGPSAAPTTLILAALIGAPLTRVSAGNAALEDTRPNILVIVTDDQRADLMSVMPKTLALFADRGVTYINALANTPLCCPARASMFTGRFAHNHTVTTNADIGGLDHSTTVQRYLQEAGYRTGIVGKFFNQWSVSDNPPFFDRWAVTSDAVRYNVDGSLISVDQYSTEYMADGAEGLVRDFEVQGSAPWFLQVATTAPHLPVAVAPEYQSAAVEPWTPAPSVTKPLDPEITDGTRRMLMSVDDLVGQLFQALEELGEADNTLAFFVSDNGFMWYEQGLWGKNKPFTESIEVPFLARWPGHLPAGAVVDDPVAHIDMAPTILDAAGLTPANTMDGRSLLAPSSRTDMLTEAWRSTGSLAWASLRTADYQYIEFFESDGVALKGREFYDLEADPWQMDNLLAQGASGPEADALHARLLEARACGGTSGCTSALTSTSVEVHDALAAEGAGQIVFEVSLSGPAGEDVQIPYTVIDGTGTWSVDHGGSSGTLLIPAGQTTGAIFVPVVQDSLDESDETLAVEISSTGKATAIRRRAAGTIADDDPPPTMTIGDASVGESAAALAVPVSLSAPSGRDVTADYSTAGGTATPGEDYIKAQGSVRIPAGATTTQVSIPLLHDTIDEPDETFTVALSSPAGATVADAEATGTIVDDDETAPPPPLPSVSISESSAGEGQAGMTFTVTLSAASSSQISVAYATANGTALAGKDYTRTLGTLKIPAAQTSGSITVPLLSDAVDEPDETFTILLTDPKGTTVADAEATGTIVDDDESPPPPVTPQVTISDASAGESGSTMTFTVTLSAASSSQISVAYATANGTALAGKDYTRTIGTLKIPAGQTTGIITVPLLGDAVDEPDENFTITLSDPKGATIAEGEAVGTIMDDDEAPPPPTLASVSIGDSSAGESDPGLTFSVTLSAAASTQVSVAYATSNGTATAGKDYTRTIGTLKIPAGQTTGIITVPLLGDAVDEPDENFTITLSDPKGATIAEGEAVGTVMDDDASP